MSEKSCNRCLFGQGEIDHFCKGCILKDRFVKSDVGVQIINPPTKDDRAPLSPDEQWKDFWNIY